MWPVYSTVILNSKNIEFIIKISVPVPQRKRSISTWEILPYMAVMKSVHRTVDVSSFIDTISILRKLADLGSIMETFPYESTKNTKTADLSSTMDTFLLLKLIFIHSDITLLDFGSFMDK